MIGLHKIVIIASMLKRLLFYCIQWTWGIPQNLAGLLVWLAKSPFRCDEKYEGAVVNRWKNEKSLSLGMFIFIGYGGGIRMIKHEYGHTIQSMILGPFYLFAVGVPSIIWCNFYPVARKWKSGMVSYFSGYPESWADRLGFNQKQDD